MSMFNGIKENDLVKIEFKELKELYSNLSELGNKMDEHNYRGCIKSMLQGGIFQVDMAPTKDNNGVEHILIDCHLDDDQLMVYEEMIKSISIVDDAPSFKSGEHGINIVRRGNELIINGAVLTKRDAYYNNNPPGLGQSKYNGDINDFKEFIGSWLVDITAEEALIGKK